MHGETKLKSSVLFAVQTDLLKSLMHPGVIALYEVIQEKTSLYIMTEVSCIPSFSSVSAANLATYFQTASLPFKPKRYFVV